MSINFTTPEYLKKGNPRQQKAYEVLTKLSIFNDLLSYNPIITGTIPIGIDLPESDLDIICECSDHKKFTETLKSLYSDKPKFKIRTTNRFELLSTIATFKVGAFKIEIFGQNLPTIQQHAYRHMIIEHRILNEKDDRFKKDIIQLKQNGLSTEEAFAELLGLEGNPYKALLKL